MPKRVHPRRLTWKQRKAIQLLVSGGQSDREVAEYLNVHIKTIRRWMHEKLFAKVLEERFQELEVIDAKYRAKMNKHIVRQVYGEIIKRLSEGQTLKKVSLNKLMTIARNFNHEIRVDTPGDVTSKSRVEHSVLEDLGERYKKHKDKGKPELTLVEPPQDEEEASNG
jgi:hypothetical protein